MGVDFSTGRASGSTKRLRQVGPRESTVCHASRTKMSGIESVAGAAHGDEVRWLFGIDLEPFAQLAYEVVDGADRSGGLAPHEAEELVAREHLIGVAQEKYEELELEMRELHFAAGARDEPLVE